MKEKIYIIIVVYILCSCKGVTTTENYKNDTLRREGYVKGEEEKWDQNYQLVNILEILNTTKTHVDSLNKGLITGNYYTGTYKYKFKALRKGEQREIVPATKQTIANIFKIHGVSPQYLDLLEYEILMECDSQQIWMPIQSQLLKPFKEEVKENKEVMLYCSLLTEYSKKGLYNIFIISEFQKQ